MVIMEHVDNDDEKGPAFWAVRMRYSKNHDIGRGC